MPPPAAVAPDSIPPALGPEDVPGGYDIYGPRVPTVVVSPYSKPNAVTNVVHDHTSVLATIERKWNLPFLTYRDANAHPVTDFLDLQAPAFLKPPTIAEPGWAGSHSAAASARARTRGQGCVGERHAMVSACCSPASCWLWRLRRSPRPYEEDMGNDPNREAAACGHPALNTSDETQKAVPGDGYATRHDPFVYFHSVIDEIAYCDKHVVALGSPTRAMPAAALRVRRGWRRISPPLRARRASP